MSTKELTKAITKALEDVGIDVKVQHAVTTTSVYLSFDGGLLKQARVGDHKGRQYNYTYEIGSHVKPPFEIEKTFNGQPYTRYRYRPEDIELLTQRVRSLRAALVEKYGKDWYARMRAMKLSTKP